LSKEEMIREITSLCIANGCKVDGDMFFALAFRTEDELRDICREMNIKI
jgi:hypothetical protein